jgi:hypothetical protein
MRAVQDPSPVLGWRSLKRVSMLKESYGCGGPSWRSGRGGIPNVGEDSFMALFGILFRPGALPSVRHPMASWTSPGLVNFGSLTGQEVRSQRHVNRLNNVRDRGNDHRLKLSLQTIGKGSVFSESERAILPGWPGRWPSGNSHHPFGNPPQQLVFGIKYSNLALHWSFLHTLTSGSRTSVGGWSRLSKWVPWRPATVSAVGFLGVLFSWISAGIGDHGICC